MNEQRLREIEEDARKQGYAWGEDALDLIEEIRRLWAQQNEAIDADFDHWAPLQTKIEQQAAEIARLRECVRVRDAAKWTEDLYVMGGIVEHCPYCLRTEDKHDSTCPTITHPLEAP